MEVTILLNDPMFNLLFYCHIILNWEKVTSYKNLGTILSLKSKLSGKFQGFNAIDGKLRCWKIVTRSKQQAPLRKLFSLPPPPTLHLTSARKMHFLDVKKWCYANNFSDYKQKHVCWKICKVRKVFSVLREHIVFNVKGVEVRKLSEILERNCIVKWVIFFVSFCYLWDFLMTSTVKCRKL